MNMEKHAGFAAGACPLGLMRGLNRAGPAFRIPAS
jgi:hypothetical protein